MNPGESVFLALQNSSFAAAIRQSSWAYATANVGHILALACFAGAIAVMDLRLAGAFGQLPALSLIRSTRRWAVAAFLGLAGTGFILFAAEAAHVAANPAFQVKVLLIVLGLANVLLFERVVARKLRSTAGEPALPQSARVLGIVSIVVWLAVAACGRSIAYF